MTDLKKAQHDWEVYVRLSRIVEAGHELGVLGRNALAVLQDRYPEWRPADEKSEFAIWSETTVGDRGDAGDLEEVPTESLLPTMRKLVEKDRWNNDGLWRRFVAAHPDRSFEALVARAEEGEQNDEEWSQLFYHLREADDRVLQTAVLKYLIDGPPDRTFSSLHALCQWFEHRYLRLVEFFETADPALMLWDRLAEQVNRGAELHQNVHADPMFAVLNEPPGQLANVLIHELDRRKVGAGEELPVDLQARFDAAIRWVGDAGLTAQCAMFAQLPFLDYVASSWSVRELAPLLAPEMEKARTRWKARFYAQKVGSVAFFNATKAGFLMTFSGASEEADDNIGDSQVLLLLQAAFEKGRGKDIHLDQAEAKNALVRGGIASLTAAARILRLKGDQDTGAKHWHEVVKPIFLFVWPGDDVLQTPQTTARLVDIALDAAEAFPDAVATLRPFMIAAWEDDSNWHFETDFDERGVELIRRHPQAGLSLLDTLIPVDRGPSRLNELLDVVAGADGTLAGEPEFVRLRGLARRLAA